MTTAESILMLAAVLATMTASTTALTRVATAMVVAMMSSVDSNAYEAAAWQHGNPVFEPCSIANP